MNYDPEKHHRRSIRLKGYNYTQAGAYFVTICVQDRNCLFGEIINGEMKLNLAGNQVYNWWNKLPQKFSNIELDKFIVMLNHVHGIIIINDHVHDCRGEVTSPLQLPQQLPYQISMTPPTLGKIIAYFKYQSTKHKNQFKKTSGIKLWQRNYFEHIIRNENELNRIRKYIIENPLRWNLDDENPNK